jgi:UDP-glucose 4-epimerase
MDVAVTGASGFLGQRIVKELSACGHAVLAVSRRAAPVPPGVDSLVVTHLHDLPPAAVLIHLAEESRLMAAEEAGDRHIADNVARVRALIAGGRFARILYGSSAAVYGDSSSRPHRPDEPLAAGSVYARAKIACEQEVLAAGGVALRFANIIGPGMGETTVLSRVLAQIPGTDDLQVRDDSAVRDYLSHDDMASCVAAFVAGDAAGAFNVGSGVGTTVRELALRALAVAGESGRRVVSGVRAARASQLVLDITATSGAVNWFPRVSLDAAIREILESRHV